MTTSIIVDGVSKQYRLGGMSTMTFREKIVDWAKSPGRRRQGGRPSVWALRDVSINVQAGEVVGIIGRNGAGKSTLLKVLSRITHPTAGQISVRGRVASLLEVGVGFHPELTGRENVYLNGSILGMRKRDVDRRFDEIVEFAGIARFIDTQVKHYSTGMRLRLGFAVAAHLEPDVLVVDEVLAVGDAGFQKKCLDAMDGMQSGGRTVLFVSHNLAAVENLCTRGIWIDEGKVRMDGPAKDVIRAYMASFADAGDGGTELSDPESRLGDGRIRFTRLEYLSPDGTSSLTMRSGDPVMLRLHYRATIDMRNVSFGFRLYTGMGTLVTETGNLLQGTPFPLVTPGIGYIDVTLDVLNLLPARYLLSLWATDERGQVVYDGDARAVFEVEAANVYPSGWLPDSRQGIVYFPQRWAQPVATE